MDNNLVQNPQDGAQPFGKSYPLSFSFYNKNKEEVLYIDNLQAGHPICLEVTNTSTQSILLAIPGDYHFQLQFKQGVLHNPSQIELQESDTWSFSYESRDQLDTFSFLCRSEQTLAPGQSFSLTLQKVCAASAGGSRGTLIELISGQLYYTGQTANPIVESRVRYLNLINRRGGQYIPLHVGFVGSNTVLNDGVSQNALKLRITNISQDAIQLTDESKFMFSFETGDVALEWSLGTLNQVAAIQLGDPVINGNSSSLKVIPPQHGYPEWQVSSQEQITLFFMDAITLDFRNIITCSPTGQTNLFVRYENIPGYWDGQFICTIEKGPLVMQGQRIGIGASDPQGILAVQWEGNTAPVPPLMIGSKNNALQSMIVSGDGKVGIGTFSPSAELEVKGYVKDKNGYIIPQGAIIMWSGAVNNIPAGWALCNGEKGTPNLQNRFIVGAGDDYNANTKGAADNHSHNVPGQTLSFDTSPSGNHSHLQRKPANWYQRNLSCGKHTGLDVYSNINQINDTSTTENGNHSHHCFVEVRSVLSSTVGCIRPPWYALCYIMKVY